MNFLVGALDESFEKHLEVQSILLLAIIQLRIPMMFYRNPTPRRPG